MMILVDIGNTTFHILDNNKDYKISVNDKLPLFDKSKIIYFVSVNNIASEKLLQAYPLAIDIATYFIFNTSFSNTIGVDRIAVCSYVKNKIIVDCGTAITVDIMLESSHLGGFIMPGFNKLQETYPNMSNKLMFNFENNINLDKIPLNTNDAINYAIMSMVVLPIKNIQNKYKLDILFTGEQSSLIQGYFPESEFQKNLIFNAMHNAIKEYK
jgi:type III pantothenate kinase